ncbi:MAG: hypothetical protein GWM90_07930, partial [Gemmatimonadetes bacterium]|nr:hypothetical protein [Gemmatimonadota bacterium]NIQ53796.1 hypothetical protein [Gemmatimonadota bacterium]NIU73970.1 hypothetical protein [Gammaproteobacteria bacterium]NIX44041.1 hypothetical protein [Gemmatimonadota bacterium]NIY08254.1 hypothetical protein [Gemmatimonadota bacterium]
VVGGIEAGPEEVCVVLVRSRGWLEQLGSWVRRERPSVVDVDVEARPVAAGPRDGE